MMHYTKIIGLSILTVSISIIGYILLNKNTTKNIIESSSKTSSYLVLDKKFPRTKNPVNKTIIKAQTACDIVDAKMKIFLNSNDDALVDAAKKFAHTEPGFWDGFTTLMLGYNTYTEKKATPLHQAINKLNSEIRTLKKTRGLLKRRKLKEIPEYQHIENRIGYIYNLIDILESQEEYQKESAFILQMALQKQIMYNTNTIAYNSYYR